MKKIKKIATEKKKQNDETTESIDYAILIFSSSFLL